MWTIEDERALRALRKKRSDCIAAASVDLKKVITEFLPSDMVDIVVDGLQARAQDAIESLQTWLTARNAIRACEIDVLSEEEDAQEEAEFTPPDICTY